MRLGPLVLSRPSITDLALSLAAVALEAALLLRWAFKRGLVV